MIKLENIAHQLSEQAKQLYMKLQAANMSNMFKRLDYLFKVVENGHMFKQDFLEKCIAEIEEIMTVPEETEEDNKEEETPDIKSRVSYKMKKANNIVRISTSLNGKFFRYWFEFFGAFS